jgi:GT2 family glycosyltransferase
MVDFTLAGTPPLLPAAFRFQSDSKPVAIASATGELTYSVIIPATDEPVTLERCLDAIRSAADPPDEVIVIDRPLGVGPAATRNAGALRARGTVLIFIDSDVVVHHDVFTRIRAAFASDGELCAVFGSYDDTPSAHGVVSTFRNLLHHYVHQSAPGMATTFWAGLGAVRRDAFIAVDGFDDWRFRAPSIEDIDLGLRLASAGGVIRLDPAIQGTHLKHWRLGSMMLTDLLYRGTPWTALMLARGPQAARLNVRGTHLLAVSAFIAGLAAAAVGRPRASLPLMGMYLALNTPFYALMHRSVGPRSALTGVALLATHNAAALGSVPLGVLVFGLERARRSMHAGHPVAVQLEQGKAPSGRAGRGRRRFARRTRRAAEDTRRFSTA